MEYINPNVMSYAEGARQSCKIGYVTLPCLGAICGSTIHRTPSTYGVPKMKSEAKEGDPCVLMANMKAIWRHDPCCLAGRQGGDKTKSGHGPLAMMGTNMWANDLHNRYHLEMYRKCRQKESCLHNACCPIGGRGGRSEDKSENGYIIHAD